jgi:hypothetical protein
VTVEKRSSLHCGVLGFGEDRGASIKEVVPACPSGMKTTARSLLIKTAAAAAGFFAPEAGGMVFEKE